jgi:hypothetical protein
MATLDRIQAANLWWKGCPEDFKVAVYELFFSANIIGYNPTSRTATILNGIVPEKKREER